MRKTLLAKILKGPFVIIFMIKFMLLLVTGNSPTLIIQNIGYLRLHTNGLYDKDSISECQCH